MSNRHEYEIKALRLVKPFLKARFGASFEIEAEHVPVGPRNCDYVLESDAAECRRVAVEIVRIVDDPDSMDRRSRQRVLWDAMTAELSKRGLTGYALKTPAPVHDVPRDIKNKIAPRIADGLAHEVSRAPHAGKWHFKGFELRPFPGSDSVAPWSITGAHYVDTPAHAERMLDTLADKVLQVQVPEAFRILTAVSLDTSLSVSDVISELARRDDLRVLGNVDLVLFIDRAEQVHEVYRRDLRDYFLESGEFPTAPDALVDGWARARLGGRSRAAFERAKAILDLRPNVLGKLTRHELALHGTVLADEGRWEDALWIARTLHRDADPPAEERHDFFAITTVRGGVCWLLARLAEKAPPTGLGDVLEITSKLADDENEYVRGMAAWPIGTLLSYRDRSREGRFVLGEHLRSEILETWRRYLSVAARSTNHRERIALTISGLVDVTPEDVNVVIDTLRPVANRDVQGALAVFLLRYAYVRAVECPWMQERDTTEIRARISALAAGDAAFAAELLWVIHRTLEQAPHLTPRFLGPLEDLLSYEIEASAIHAAFGAARSLIRQGIAHETIALLLKKQATRIRLLSELDRRMVDREVPSLSELIDKSSSESIAPAWSEFLTKSDD